MNTDNQTQSTVLIIDDKPDNLRLLAEILRQQSYKVRSAPSAAHAKKTINKELPDIILLDIMMPGMDGYQFCRLLKENPTTQHIPVIFLSAKSETSDKVTGFDLGAVDYITKPFDIDEVLARVNVHLDIKERLLKNKRTQKYSKSGLSNEQLTGILGTMNQYMTSEQPYLNAAFSIETLSVQLDIPKHNISESINKVLKKNFSTFVNEFRIEHVIQQLKSGKQKTVTLLGIALDAGFQSKSAFNAFFKKSLGTTPKDFIKELES